MTISAAYAINQDNGNGSTRIFSVNFPFGGPGDLVVQLFDTVAQANISPAPVLNGAGTYDYTVSGTPNSDTGIYPNGSVTFNNAPPSTYEAVRARATPLLQSLSLGNNGRFPAKSVEGALDRAELQLQELSNILSRMPITPLSDAPVSQVLPPAAVRKGKLAQFNSSTGVLENSALSATDIANIPANVAAAQAAAAAAVAADADVTFNLTLIQSYGLHKGANNIFDAMPSNVIAKVQARDASIGYLNSYFNTAFAAPGKWIFPPGEYHLNGTMEISAGFEFIGLGRDPTIGTVIYTGGSTGVPAGEQLNSNGVASVEGYSMRDICWQITQGGFRWNSVTGGFTDDASSQKYIINPRVYNCLFNMDSVTRYTALQFNKCFDGDMRLNRFTNFLIDVDFEGSDNCVFDNNRSDGATDVCVLANAQGTFGNNLVLTENDWNNPKNNFVRWTYRSIRIFDNHLESDFNPGSSGTGGNMVAAFDGSGGNAFHSWIHDNEMDGLGFWDNWLRMDGQNNHYTVSAFGNNTASNPASMGGVLWTSPQPYFNNSGGRCIIRHGGNGGVPGGFPMNTEEASTGADPLNLMLWTPGRRGLVAVSGNPTVANNALVLTPNGPEVELSDFPTPVVGGGVDINIQMMATVANQALQFEIRDGASIFQAYATLPSIGAVGFSNYHLYVNGTFSTALKIRLKNTDTGHNGNVLIRSVSFRQA